MPKEKVGKLPPRYSFILNPYPNERLSKCPQCRRLTHMRKFALLIVISDWGAITLGKTCRYCTPCELIMAHRDDLEDELARSFTTLAPDVIGNPYFVVGTVDKRVWWEQLGGRGNELDRLLANLADFKQVLDLKVEPGGWYPPANQTNPK